MTDREIFCIKLGIKSHLPLLGHYFENKSAVVLALHFGVLIPAAGSTKTLKVLQKMKERCPKPSYSLAGDSW